MLPESSIHGHLFIKVRNCCLSLFIAANVTWAAVTGSESLCAGWGCPRWEVAGTQTGARAPSRGCRRCLGLPGLSLTEERLSGLSPVPLACPLPLAGGSLGLSRALTPADFPLRDSCSLRYQGLCTPERGWGGIWTPQPCECEGIEGRGEFFLILFPELLAWPDKEMLFLWQRQIDRARPSGIPAAASALRRDKYIPGETPGSDVPA